MTIRVVVVDDDPLARTALSTILGADIGIEVVGEASDGAGAVEMATRLRPDVVVMDIRMPVVNGIDATRHLTSLRPPPGRVLILTTFGDEEYVFASLRAGASGFLLKNAPTEQLTGAVRTVAVGDALLAPAVTRMVVERYLTSAGQIQSSGRMLDRLTPREVEVMTWMARGLSNRQIADELVLGQTTVKTHVARILTKLAVRDGAQVVIVAYESGLVVSGDTDGRERSDHGICRTRAGEGGRGVATIGWVGASADPPTLVQSVGHAAHRRHNHPRGMVSGAGVGD